MKFLKILKNQIFFHKLYKQKDPSFLHKYYPLNHILNTPCSCFNYTHKHAFCSISSNFLSSYDNETVDNLVSLFTRRPFCPNSQELTDLAPRITPKVVESVLKSFKNWRVALMFFNWASNQMGYKHNCYTYNAMAFILSDARQNAQLRVLAKDLVHSRCVMNPGALGFFIRCLGNQGMLEEVVFLFDEVKRLGLCVPNSYTYNCLLEAISKSCGVELMETRLKEMSDMGWKPDKFTLTPVLQCYCNAGKFDKALEVFSEINRCGWLDSHVLSILVLSFSKWGEVDKAVELIEKMEQDNVSLNEKTIRVLIHGFVKESRTDKALQLFDKMMNLGFLPDISLYDVLIGGLCKNEEFDKALHLYKRMNNLGVRPDVKVITVLLSSLPVENDVLKIFKETKEYVDSKSMILLYNSLLNGLVVNGSYDKAYHLLKVMMGDISGSLSEIEDFLTNMDNVKPDTNSFGIVITGLCHAAKLDLALKLFQDMELNGCKRNQLIYNNIIDCLSNSNRLDECYRLLKEMKELGIRPTRFTHNSIFGCLCRRGDVAGAVNILKDMRISGHDPWIKHSTLLVKSLCNNGKVNEACEFLAKMVQEGFVPDIVAYSAAINGFLNIQEVDRALELFKEISVHGRCPDVIAYNIILKGLCKSKRLLEAEIVLKEMLEKGLVPSVVTYNLLIDAWCKDGDIDRAIVFFKKMDEESREANVITYTTLIDGLCNAGRPEDAVSLWNEMVGKHCTPNEIAFMAFISGLSKCGRPDEAIVYFREMREKDMKPDTFVYIALIDAFLSKSNSPPAFDIFVKMVQDNKIPNLTDKSCVNLKDAILKLSEDPRTSSDMKDLIAEGTIQSFLNNSADGN